MYCFLRSSHGGLGTWSVSLHSSTMVATSSPNFSRISASTGAPPWSSTASCSSAAMA